MSKERTARTAIPRGSKASPGKKPSATKYPKPDRSDQVRHRTKDADGSIDIGWTEGTLKDGRPYVAELWAEDQLTLMVVFISKKGIPSLGRDASARLLEENGIVTFLGKRYCSARSFIDPAGNPVWSINLVIGDEDETYATYPITFSRYVYPLGTTAEKPKGTPTRLVGTILSDVGGVQTVEVQDAPAYYLESLHLEGKQRAAGGRVGDRVNLTWRTTASYAMWFGKVALVKGASTRPTAGPSSGAGPTPEKKSYWTDDDFDFWKEAREAAEEQEKKGQAPSPKSSPPSPRTPKGSSRSGKVAK